ncbi:TPA: M50 family metallopeptidase [Klebsiella pneumoniae]
MIKGIPLLSFENLQYVVDSLGWMLPVYLYLFSFLYALIHESGHALMAMCLGTRVTRFQVGKPVWFRFKWGRLILKFGFLFPDGGVSYCYENDALRWKVMAAALAGPLLPVILSVPVFTLTSIQPLTIIAGLIVMLLTLVNLNPFMRETDGQKGLLHLHAIVQGRKALSS